MGRFSVTNLNVNESVTVPDSMFETNYKAKERIIYSKCIEKLDEGILIEIQFMPGFGSEDPIEYWRMRKFITYSSLYCGAVKLYKADRTQVNVKLKGDYVNV